MHDRQHHIKGKKEKSVDPVTGLPNHSKVCSELVSPKKKANGQMQLSPKVLKTSFGANCL